MPTNSESLMWEARIKLPRENLEELLGNIVSNSSLIRAGGNPDIGIYELSILEMAVSILKVLEENHPTRKIYAYSVTFLLQIFD